MTGCLRAGSVAHLDGIRWIREDAGANRMSANALSQWMLRSLQVSVPARICQTWLSRDCSTSGKLLVCEDVEKELGERLRLGEHRERFASEARLVCF